MTESAFLQAVVVSVIALLFGVFAWIPVTRGPRAFFGVRVDAGYFEGAGKLVLRRYRLVLAAVFLAVVAIAAALRPLTGLPAVLVGGQLAITIATVVVYLRFASAVRSHASTAAPTRFASSMRTREARDRAWLTAIAVALVALSFAVPALSYGEMPLRIPIHWNAAGKADGWVARSLPAVLFAPLLGAYLQFFLYVIRRDFAGAKMTLPAEATEEYLLAKEKYLRTNIDTLDWTRATMAVAFCGISLMQTFTVVERLKPVEPVARASVFLGLAALLGGVVFFLGRMVRINARLQRETGDDYVQRATDERHWIHGGLTYSNPDDPALVVEKLVGVGYTLNMAHPGIRPRLLLMIGIPALVVLAVLTI